MIFRNSRYTKTPLYNRDGNLIFKIRTRNKVSEKQSMTHVYSEGDRLDLLAFRYYADDQLWWVLLEANKQFRSEMDIPYGAELIIPSFDEVLSWIQ